MKIVIFWKLAVLILRNVREMRNEIPDILMIFTYFRFLMHIYYNNYTQSDMKICVTILTFCRHYRIFLLMIMMYLDIVATFLVS